MKFIVSSSQLLKQLQGISGVLNTSNTLPILDNFLFEIQSNELTVSVSDLETTMKTKVPNTEASETGNIAIPAKLLIDTLKTFSEQPLTFLIDKNTNGIEIGSDNGKYKLTGQNGDEFPKTPEMESPSSTTLRTDILSDAINKTLFATGNDELRPIMSGVFCELTEEGCTFVATDAHKLVKHTRTDVKSEKTASFILPKKPLNILKNNILDDESIKLEFNDTNAMFSFNNITIICRLVDGKYPNYEAVIPKENPNVLTIDRQLFLNSVRRVSIFSNKTTNQIKLKIAGSLLNISAEDFDFSNKADENLECQYSGDDIQIGFNSKFLIEMLNNLDSEMITLSMSHPNRAGIIRPVSDNDNVKESITMLVMPVMLND